MSGWQQKKQRILRTLESGVSYKALRRVTNRLADEHGPLRQCIQLTTEVKGQRVTFDWEVVVCQRILPAKKSLEELMGLMNQAKNNLASHEPSD